MTQNPPPEIIPFFHEPSSSYSYVVNATVDNTCVVIDPVLDCDGAHARTSTAFADSLIAHIRQRKLSVAWVLETHAHADRLSAGAYLAEKLGARIGAMLAEPGWPTLVIQEGGYALRNLRTGATEFFRGLTGQG